MFANSLQLDYDATFGTLLRRKSTYPLDGIPLVAGLACLLKQFHPSTTHQLVSYLGQFIKCTLQHAMQDSDGNNAKSVEIPKEVVNTIIFLEQVSLYSGMSRSSMHAYVPAYIFDAIRIAAAKPK